MLLLLVKHGLQAFNQFALLFQCALVLIDLTFKYGFVFDDSHQLSIVKDYVLGVGC